MTQPIGADHVQQAIDAILGIDPSQAPTEPAELNERLTTPQPGITEALTFLMTQQQSRQIPRGLPFAYVLLEAAERANPEEMKEAIKSKAFVTAIATAAGESRTAGMGDGVIGGSLKEKQPVLVDFLERQLGNEGSWVRKLSQDDRIGLYALCLGTVRAIDRHLSGAERPVQAVKEPGRNEPCHCGSGKKFKKCHGAPAA